MSTKLKNLSYPTQPLYYKLRFARLRFSAHDRPPIVSDHGLVPPPRGRPSARRRYRAPHPLRRRPRNLVRAVGGASSEKIRVQVESTVILFHNQSSWSIWKLGAFKVRVELDD